jgi:hypothetical protein
LPTNGHSWAVAGFLVSAPVCGTSTASVEIVIARQADTPASASAALDPAAQRLIAALLWSVELREEAMRREVPFAAGLADAAGVLSLAPMADC